MAETLATLKDTPIPNLLIIGGIALLVLPVASNVAGKVQVAGERQKWAGNVGLILVAALEAEGSFPVTGQTLDSGLIFSDKKQTFIQVDTAQTWEVVE